jgi:uroporphyrinogen decarboxylase
MTSRERLRRTLEHEAVDRPPVDLGSTPNTTISRIAYARLRRFLGLPEESVDVVDQGFQTVRVGEDVLNRLKIDTRPVFPDDPARNHVEWVGEGVFVDEWGIEFREARDQEGNVLYYGITRHPLSDIDSIDEIESYRWPDSCNTDAYQGLKDKAKALRENTDFGLVGHPGDTSIFEVCWYLRGMEGFFGDMLINKPLAEALLEKVLEVQCNRFERYLEEVGDSLDVVAVGDDLGTQSSLLISPQLYREMIKPYHDRYFQFIKSRTPAKLKLHSCGAIMPLLDDFIEIGVDIMNPVQVSAIGMDPAELKERFGDQLVFWGGIDTQQTLSRGNTEDVRREVEARIEQLGSDGGYVVSAVHNIQADVPPKNIVAMFETATDRAGID